MTKVCPFEIGKPSAMAKADSLLAIKVGVEVQKGQVISVRLVYLTRAK